MRVHRDSACLFRTGICGSEQERRHVSKTAVCAEKGTESLLRDEFGLRHSAALRSVQWDSDHHQPDTYYRAHDSEIIPATIGPVMGTPPNAGGVDQ
jgi:hypothetical protein